MTCNAWHVTHGGGWTFSQNFSFSALMLWDRQCLEDSELKGDPMNELMNDWMNDEGAYRTAPATWCLIIGKKIAKGSKERKKRNKKRKSFCKYICKFCAKSSTFCLYTCLNFF